MDFYIYVEKNIKPVILLVCKIVTGSQDNIIHDICSQVFELLYEQKIVTSKSILAFLLLKEYNNKRAFYIQGSIKSNEKLINTLDNNKFVEKLSSETIAKSLTSFVLSFDIKNNKINKIVLKEKKENLCFLNGIWLSI